MNWLFILALVLGALPLLMIGYVMVDTLRQPEPWRQIFMLEDIGLYAEANELRRRYWQENSQP